jgi:hypothetical protein
MNLTRFVRHYPRSTWWLVLIVVLEVILIIQNVMEH